MLDTQKYAKRLEAADIPRKQAEAHAEALREALAEDKFATKGKGLFREIRAKIKLVKQGIRAEFRRFGHMYIAHGETIVILFILLKYFR